MTVDLIVGVDTGAVGAIAFMAPDATLLAIYDMPIDKVKVGTVMSSRVDPIRLWAIISGCPAGTCAFIEEPEAFPIVTHNRRTGRTETQPPSAKRMLAFGRNIGITAALCAIAGMHITEIGPREWKAAMSLPANKDECRRLAAIKFPAFADQFKRDRDDGRAESAYLALYGWRQLFRG